MTLRLPAVLAATLLLSACSSGASEQSDESFCEAIQDWNTALVDMSVGMSDLGDYLSSIEDPTDLPPSDVMHEMAAGVLTSAADADQASAIAVANTRDPEVADTIVEMNRIIVDVSRWMGETALESEDALEFTMTIIGEFDRMTEFEDSADKISSSDFKDYVVQACGDLGPINGVTDPAKEADTDAKTDVSTLGHEIATYYVDNVDPDPTITIQDGRYYLLDTYIWDVSTGNRVTDQYYNGYTDWCVEVTNDLGYYKTFTYSAQDWLQQGTCQQLRLP